MKRLIALPEKTRRLAAPLLSFSAYLIARCVFGLLQSTMGAGELFLLFLLIVPGLFILWELSVGALSYVLLGRIGLAPLVQLAVLAFSLLVFLALDCAMGRVVFSSMHLSDFLLELTALVTCPPLVWCGGRVARFFVRRRTRAGK